MNQTTEMYPHILSEMKAMPRAILYNYLHKKYDSQIQCQGKTKLCVPLKKTVPLHCKTEGHITGLAFPWSVFPLVAVLAKLTFQPAFGCFAAAWNNGDRDVVGFPTSGDTCCICVTKLTDQLHPEVFVGHRLHSLGTA